ncbi:MAG: molybdopterin-dependent oxidoreductase, partial [Bdellovibrionales bacterium]|nr:molybdopterin-dependent oxidoreductase [Bdellovibrionales bacterium]
MGTEQQNQDKISEVSEEGMKSESGQVSRRTFLKILGSGTVAGAVGCADSATQNVLPFVKGQRHQITGEDVWYRTTCRECSAGCGIQVRTREGRALKIEGNPDSPINKGGVCAVGHSALQDLYDPDRIRQPLKKNGVGGFSPISWADAYKELAARLRMSKGKRAFLDGGVSGSERELLDAWCKAFSVQSVTCDLRAKSAEARAAELVYGQYAVPTFDVENADVIVNFGSDFLETWISPVEFAYGWGKSRKSHSPVRVVHFEPRLSLTAANADHWFCAAPGSEVQIALFLLKRLLELGRGDHLSSDVLARMRSLVQDIEIEKVVSVSGVSRERILLVADYLNSAKSPLVLAGGASLQTTEPLSGLVAANFVNLVLGSVGKTVNLASRRAVTDGTKGLEKLIARLNTGEIRTLFV